MKAYWRIIDKYFSEGSTARCYYLPHVESVTAMALDICRRNPNLNIDMDLVETAAMLHDIGIFYVDTPEIGCYGNAPYIQHGILGAELLRKEGLGIFAPFCENHVGTGISKEDVVKRKLPLPERDMTPQTIEQELVAYVDKFFSKSQNDLTKPKNIEKIYRSLSKYGDEKIRIFDAWRHLFGGV